MIKKYLEYINEDINGDIRKIMSVEDIEDQLLRLKEVLNCKTVTEFATVYHGAYIDKYYIQWDKYDFPTQISFGIEPPYEYVYEFPSDVNYRRLPNLKEINAKNVNIGILISKEMEDVRDRIKNMHPELYVYIIQNDPHNYIWLDNNNLKSYRVAISIGQLKSN